MDEIKKTRKRFKEELRAKIPSDDLNRINQIQSEAFDVFTTDLIEFAEETEAWPVLLTQVAPDLVDISESVRIFILQKTFRELSSSPLPLSTPSSKRYRPIHVRGSDEDEVSMSSSYDEDRIIASPGYRATRKSAPVTQRTCYIETFRVRSGDEVSSSFKQIPPDARTDIQEIRATLLSGEDHKINIKRCSCNYSLGTGNVCECFSEVDQYLVPRRVIRSRQVSLTRATELLIEWQPFPDKTSWPHSWIPIEPLAIWSSRVLMDYLLTRIEYN